MTMKEQEKVYELLREFDTTMMVTHAPSGPLDCRPMRVAASEVDRGGPLWFVTSVETRKVKELSGDSRVLLIGQHDGEFLCVWGEATVTDDRDKTRSLWSEAYRVWFPKGLEDPDLRLVKVVPHAAEYWDNTGVNKARYLFEATKAYATGERVKVDSESQHGRTTL